MIVLTHAYFIEEDMVEKKIMKPYPPLGLLYISGYLESKKLEHEVIDTTFSSFIPYKQELAKLKPKILGIYVNFLTRPNVLKTIDFIKSSKEFSATKIILGGPDVRYNKEEYLRAGADFLVLGEGELSFYELSKALLENENPQTVNGIAFLDKTGELITYQERNHIKEIDELPFPNRKKINFQKYFNTWQKYHGYRSVTINTQRGCPYTCKWCSHAVYGDTYRRRSPESVVMEIIDLEKNYKPGSYWFVDDVFTMSQSWIFSFAELIKKKGIKISYECISRADRLNEGIIKALKESGCKLLWIGAESGSQKVIDLMDRRVDIAQVQNMIRMTKSYGIETGTFIMIGYPGEKIEDIKLTVQHLKKSKPDYFTINIAYPIKGTKLYKEIEDSLSNHIPWKNATDREVDFKRTYSRRFYDFAIKWAYNEVKAFRQIKKGNLVGYFKNKMKAGIAYTFMILNK